MIYFISDTHFGHKGSLTWPGGNARPFKDAKQMNSIMISNWNAIVSPEDTVYHLGDFAYKASTTMIKYWFNSLNGEIILIKGNHDGQTLKANKQQPRFSFVHDLFELEWGGKLFVLCHYPIESWKNKSHGSIHLHGHTHGSSIHMKNRVDVSVEVTGYRPLSILDIMAFTANSII